MKNKRILRSAWTSGAAALLLMIPAASANTIVSYTTNSAGTGFAGSGLVLNSISGQPATLTFSPNTASVTGVPSNIDLGDFILACTDCTQAQTTTFGSFTFNLVVNDTSDNAFGQFVGTSSGGTVSANGSVSNNSSTLQINWVSPVGLVLGGGTNHASSGNFGNTVFSMISPSILIVAPNSGSVPGDTSVEGPVSTASSLPEPATFAMIGGGLLALGLLRKKRQAV
jgi:hypothetical protein